jgi:Virulence-associated protein E
MNVVKLKAAVDVIEHNKFAISMQLRAGEQVSLMEGDNAVFKFNAQLKLDDIENALKTFPSATAWIIGGNNETITPCPGYLLSSGNLSAGNERLSQSEAKPKAVPKPAPKTKAQPGDGVADGEAQPSAAAPSTPATIMRRSYSIPSRPKGGESINDYVAEDGSIKWPDLKKIAWSGLFEPRPTCANARVAILALGVECGYDVFHDRKVVAGRQIQEWAGELSDHTCQMLRVIIQRQYLFDPGRENTRDAVDQLCLQNSFDPVCDYLDGLKWDGKPRLDKWMVQYLGADDTELNRAIGRLSLVAAVRRVRQPGCKFDQIIVLEGVEGKEKSKAIETMAGEENFSDQSILGLDDKTQMERLKGKWLYEIAELTGIRRAEVEMVKAFVSRRTDRARPAYGRNVVEQPRRCVLFATTNEDAYLKSQTGNRRFWPVKTGDINSATLHRDRDQLWAEAAKAEASGESIVLPRHLWSRAQVEQDARLEHDPWDDILADVKGDVHKDADGDEERIASRSLLLDYLKIPSERANKEAERKLAQCMRRLGWEGPATQRIAGQLKRGYRRRLPSSDASDSNARPPWRRANKD